MKVESAIRRAKLLAFVADLPTAIAKMKPFHTLKSRTYRTKLSILVWLLAPSTAFLYAVDIQPGQLIVYNQDYGAANLLAIDPQTGAQTVVYPSCIGINGLTVDSDGTIVAAYGSLGVVRIDPKDGSLQTISSGGLMVSAQSVAINGNGDIYVGDNVNNSQDYSQLLRIDPLTGEQTIAMPPAQIRDSENLAIGTNGIVYVWGRQGQPRAYVPLTGKTYKQPYAGGAGMANAMTLDTNGDFIIASELYGILRYNGVTGARSVISSNGFFDSYNVPWGISWDTNRTLIVSLYSVFTPEGSAILRIDPTTGEQTVISTGDQLVFPMANAVYPVIQTNQPAGVYWTRGALTFNWGDAGNWSSNALPGANDAVLLSRISGGSNRVITFDAAVGSSNTIQSLRLFQGATAMDVRGLSVLTNMHILGDASIEASNGFVYLDLRGSPMSNVFNVGGWLTVSNSAFTTAVAGVYVGTNSLLQAGGVSVHGGFVTNFGAVATPTVTLDGGARWWQSTGATLNVSVWSNLNGSIFNIPVGASVTVTNGFFNDTSARLLIMSNNTASFGGFITNSPGGVVQLINSVTRFGGPFVNSGLLVVDPSTGYFDSVVLDTGAVLTNDAGSAMFIAGDFDNRATNRVASDFSGAFVFNGSPSGGPMRTQLVEMASFFGPASMITTTNFFFGTFQVGDAASGSNALVRLVNAWPNTAEGTLLNQALAASNLAVATIASVLDLNGGTGFAFNASNLGTILATNGTARLDVQNTFTNQGVIHAGGGGSLSLNAPLVNAGTITNDSGGSLVVGLAMTNLASGRMAATGGASMTFNGSVSNAGVIFLDGGSTANFNAGLTSTGTVAMAGGSTAVVNGTLTVGRSGVLTAASTNDMLIIRGDFVNQSILSNSFDIFDATVIFGGSTPLTGPGAITNTFEVASRNRHEAVGSFDFGGFTNNFAFGELWITNNVRFVNLFDNGSGLGTNEALYVDVLKIDQNAAVIISNMTVYVGHAFYDGNRGLSGPYVINETNAALYGFVNLKFSDNGQIVFIPEPSTWTLLALGMAGVARRRRHRVIIRVAP